MLLSELRADVAELEITIRRKDNKEDRLLSVITAISEGNVPDLQSFLNDVVASSIYRWNEPPTNRSTLDDLLGPGRFGIIKESGIRSKISKYYTRYEQQAKRMHERETEYPNLIYQLILRNESEYELDTRMNDKQAKALFGQVIGSPLPS